MTKTIHFLNFKKEMVYVKKILLIMAALDWGIDLKQAELIFYLGTVEHCCLGMVLHCCRGIEVHSCFSCCFGTLVHSCLGTSLHSCLGTLTHCSLGTVEHCCLGTLWHCCFGTCFGILEWMNNGNNRKYTTKSIFFC